MAEILPRIQIRSSTQDVTRPETASPSKDPDFADAVEFQTPTRRTTTGPAFDSLTRPAPFALQDATTRGMLERGSDGQISPEQSRPLSQRSVDPVSQAIYERTGNGPAITISQRTQRQSDSISQALGSSIIDGPDVRPSTDTIRADPGRGFGKDRKKGVAFLARRIIGNVKREEQEAESLDSSEVGDDRPEGADVEMFYQAIDNMGYAPKHRPPPPYVKMRSKYKRAREFNRMFLAQQLRDFSTTYRADQVSINSAQSLQSLKGGPGTSTKAIWALEVSKDGKYLASAGQDHLIRIWPVISSAQDRAQFSRDEEAHMKEGQAHLTAPVFRDQPLRTFSGHTGDILSVSWSKNNFLLSSSTDKTARLWHVSRNECLCAFKHSDFVTSVAFHPRDDRFFLAGSLDSKLRLWSIPDKKVAYWNQTPDMITSVAFTPDGKQAMAGTLGGFCMFYETEGLRYQTQIHVKSRTGKNAKGSKITGIKAMHVPPAGSNQSSTSLNSLTDVKLLITSNDSRLRLYNLRDKSLEMKFKGHENLSSQIHARFSDDGRYVISGSEDKKVYIWSTNTSDSAEASNSRKDHWPVEIFEAHNANTTCALFLPARSRQHLSASEDPIYDICNPPPVTLSSRSEAADVSFTSIRHSVTIENPSPSDAAPAVRPSMDSTRRASETNSSYLARSSHSNGNVLIAASADGRISVFRQDCAWRNRSRSNADPSAFTHASDISSIKRMGSNIKSRSSMSMSRPGNSPKTLSRQNSTTSNRSSIGGPTSLRHVSNGTVHSNNLKTHGSDRIMSWRQSISGSSAYSFDRDVGYKPSPALSVTSTGATSPALPQMRAGNRSQSPRKSFGFPKRSSTIASNARSAPAGEPGPAITGANLGLDGATSSPARSSRPSSFITNSTPSKDQTAYLARPSEPQRGQSYWTEEAWHDEVREQLQVPARQIAVSSPDTSRSPSASPAPRNRNAYRANGKLSAGGSSDEMRRTRGLEVNGLPELEQKLTRFSALSDHEGSIASGSPSANVSTTGKDA